MAEYRKLYEQLYAGGRALRELERLQTVLASSKAIDVATLDAEANELRGTIRSRRTELASVLGELD